MSATKLFIGWSGTVSKEIGLILKAWLNVCFDKSVLQVFISEDIEPGRRWSHELAHRLQECDIGIFVYTQNNLNSLWMAFEAGALSKRVEQGRVIPLVFGANVIALKDPLAQFQGRRFTLDEMIRTFTSINSWLTDKREQNDLEELVKWTFENIDRKIQKALDEEEEENNENTQRPEVGEVLDNMYSLMTKSPLYSSDFAEEISELVQEVKSSRASVSELMEQVKTTLTQVKTTLSGTYKFIDGQTQAFSALIAATERAKNEIRSTRFSPMAISNNIDEYGKAIEKRVLGTDGFTPVQRYIRIIAVNKDEKMNDIETYLEKFRGKNFELYLTKNYHSFEMVTIDASEVFIHFYGEGQIISSTLNIVGEEVTRNFINVYEQLYSTENVLRISFKEMTLKEAHRWRRRINDFFDADDV